MNLITDLMCLTRMRVELIVIGLYFNLYQWYNNEIYEYEDKSSVLGLRTVI